MLDSTYLKPYRTAPSLRAKQGGVIARSGAPKAAATPNKKTGKYDKRRYKRRNRIEIMFGQIKDGRRVATRSDRCPETFFPAITLAAAVLFCL